MRSLFVYIYIINPYLNQCRNKGKYLFTISAKIGSKLCTTREQLVYKKKLYNCNNKG
jgi:hypothetical protein